MECHRDCYNTRDKTCCIVCKYMKNRICTHPEMDNANKINCNPIMYLNKKSYSDVLRCFKQHNIACNYSDLEKILTEKEKKRFVVEMI